MPPLLLTNIGQLLTISGAPGPRRAARLGEIGLIKDAAVLCDGGKIIAAGKRRDAERNAWLKPHRRKVLEVDCRGGVVLPGFVDSHTHPAFAAPRLLDFEKRIAGATYDQIAAAGGGIRSSVDGVRQSTRAGLARKIVAALQEMAAQGTTTVEAKSGYGLDLQSELKSLQSIQDAARCWPGTVVPTLLGAHVVPREYEDRREEYIAVICDDIIPQAARRNLARFVDVFVERGAFSMAEARAIFAAARQYNLRIRAHVGQFSAAEVQPVLEFEPASLDHMDHVSDQDIAILAKRDTIATLVPGANYFLGLNRFPPARNLIDAGVPVALATDYNPGSSPTSNVQIVLSLACTHMRMSPAEAISAATINGAHALRVADRKGSIEPGKDADMAVFAVRDYREIAYWFGSNLCGTTVVQGQIWEPSMAANV